MTTNTAKIAEAIGLLSDVLSTEVAATKHFVDDDDADDDDDEFVTIEEYEELKEAVSDELPSIITEVDGLKTDITCLVDVSDDDDDDWDDNWGLGDDDDDDEEDAEEGEATDDTEAEPTAEEKIEALETAGAELEEANEQLTDLLKEIHTGLGSIESSLIELQDDVESR